VENRRCCNEPGQATEYEDEKNVLSARREGKHRSNAVNGITGCERAHSRNRKASRYSIAGSVRADRCSNMLGSRHHAIPNPAKTVTHTVTDQIAALLKLLDTRSQMNTAADAAMNVCFTTRASPAKMAAAIGD
jgi:hypothetical protein